MATHSPAIIPRGAAALFHSLSDPTRLAIIAVLAHGEHCVKDLIEEVGLAQSTVSAHIACLKGCGLVEGRPQGRQMLYSLTGPDVLDLLASAQKVLWATGYQADECPQSGATDRQPDCDGEVA